jgi:hypothetical protein
MANTRLWLRPGTVCRVWPEVLQNVILTSLYMNPVHRVDEQTARIELTQGYAALVDQASLWLLLPYQWCVHQVRGKLYARTQSQGQVIYMHRLLLKAPADSRFVVEHRNGDGLDNRRSNLRLTTRRQKAHTSATIAKRSASARSNKSRRRRRTRLLALVLTSMIKLTNPASSILAKAQ